MAITLPVAVVIFAVFVASVHGNTCDTCDECSLSNVEILHDLIDARINAMAATRAEEFTAALGERFTAIVDDRISTVSTTLSALNATVDERLTTVTTTLGDHDASIAKLLSQQGSATAIEMLHLSLTGNQPRTIQLRSINSTTQALGSVLSTLTLENPSDGYNRLAADNGLNYLPNRLRNLGGDTAILLINMEMVFSYYVCNQVSPVCHLFTYGPDSFHFGKPFFYVSDVGDNFAPFFGPTNKAGTYGFGVSGCSAFDSACVSDFEVTVVCLLPPDHHDQCG